MEAELGAGIASATAIANNGGGEEEEEEGEEGEEEEVDVDVTTPLPSLPDGAISSVYHTSSSSVSGERPPHAGGGRRGRGRGRKVAQGASHHFTVRERVALFLSLWPYTVPLVRLWACVG